MATNHPDWCHLVECITDPVDGSRVHRSAATVSGHGPASLMTRMVDDGSGPGLMVEVDSPDPLGAGDVTGLVRRLEQARAGLPGTGL